MRIAYVCLVTALLLAGGTSLSASTSGLYADLDFPGFLTAEQLRQIGLEQSDLNAARLALDPVGIVLGEQLHHETDVLLDGPLKIGFARDYGVFTGRNSELFTFYFAADSPMGANWVHNYQFLLRRIAEDRVIVHLRRGRVVAFDRAGGEWTMVQPGGIFLYQGTPYQLVGTAARGAGTRLELMDPVTSHVVSFDATALEVGDIRRPAEYRDRNGNTLSFGYTNGNLTSITDPFGRSLSLGYVVSGGAPRIASVTTHDGRVVQYGYTGIDLVSVTNGRGHTTEYAYETPSPGLQVPSALVRIARARGNTPVENTYELNARVLTQTDGEGNTTSFTYGLDRTTITDPLGNTRLHVFDAQGRVVSFTDEIGNSISYGYDAFQRTVSVTDREGDTSTLTYHQPSGKVASRTDNLGNTWSYTYSLQQQDGFDFWVMTRIDHPHGTAVDLSHDAAGNVTEATDAAGYVFQATYNARGQLLTRTNPEGSTDTYTWNTDATLASHTDGAGNVTTYDYDSALRMTGITRPDGSVVAITWDANDNPLTLTRETGHTTTWTWDANDNLSSVTDPLGQTTTFTYDGNDDLVRISDPLGAARVATRDPLRRIDSVTDRSGRTIDLEYEPRRWLSRIVAPGGATTTLTYDREGVPTSRTDPSGETTTWTSDRQGRITGQTTALGHTTRVTLDPFGQPSSLVGPLGEITDLVREERGLLTGIDAPEGISAAFSRDSLGGVPSLTDPRGNLHVQSYDPLGRRIAHTDPLGRQTGYAYDDRRRLDEITFADGATMEVDYDQLGLPTAIMYSDGKTRSATWDEANRLTAFDGITLGYREDGLIVESNGATIARDASGRVTRLTVPPGFVVDYTYDDRGLPRTVEVPSLDVSFTLTHDEDGRLVTLERSNGVTSTYSYDADGRLDGLMETSGARGSGSLISDIQLTRDADGRVVEALRSRDRSIGLVAAVDEYGWDAANQLQQATHDLRGRRLLDDQHSYEWNVAGELIHLGSVGGRSIPGFTFSYDPLGSVVTVDGAGSSRELHYVYGLGRPALVVSMLNGQLERFFVPSPSGQLLGSVRGTSVSFYHPDDQGSIALITDRFGEVTYERAWGDPLGATSLESGLPASGIDRMVRNPSGDLETVGGPILRDRQWVDPQTAAVLEGFEFNDLFLINGVVVSEKLRDRSLPLFVEDPVAETTAVTVAPSAPRQPERYYPLGPDNFFFAAPPPRMVGRFSETRSGPDLAVGLEYCRSFLEKAIDLNYGGFGQVLDLRTIYKRGDPRDLITDEYTGVLSQSLFGEVQFSSKTFGFGRDDDSSYSGIFLQMPIKDPYFQTRIGPSPDAWDAVKAASFSSFCVPTVTPPGPIQYRDLGAEKSSPLFEEAIL